VKLRRVIDLSWTLRPGKETRHMEIHRLFAPPSALRDWGEGWYSLHSVSMLSHVGTHLESPYHFLEKGEDLSRLPLARLVGEAAVLDLTGAKPQEGLDPARLEAAAHAVGGLAEHDIVFLCTGHDRYYGTKEYQRAPYLTHEAGRWLAEGSPKLVGIDTSGASDPDRPGRENHLVLFERGIPYVENLKGLTEIVGRRVFVVCLPVAVEGLEAIPVRVVALVEDEDAT